MTKYILKSGFLGLFVSLFFLFFWEVIDNYFELGGSFSTYIFKLMLYLWPSSIFNMAATGSVLQVFQVLSISTAVNVLLYAFLGSLLWLTKHKHKAFLLPFLLVIIALWWGITTLL
jgi:hypothetical protein